MTLTIMLNLKWMHKKEIEKSADKEKVSIYFDVKKHHEHEQKQEKIQANSE